LGVAALAEVIAVVAKEFFQAGTGDIGEFQLGFLGRARNLAALGDVLVAAARIWSWDRDLGFMKRSQKRTVAS
jgi:hypothetical protein